MTANTRLDTLRNMLDMSLRQAALGAAIQAARKEKKWKQRELAVQIPGRNGPIDTQTVSRWERGENTPDIETLELVAKVLGKPLSYFVAEEDATPVDPSTAETLRLTALSQEAAAEAIVGAGERIAVAADRMIEAAERLERAAVHMHSATSRPA